MSENSTGTRITVCVPVFDPHKNFLPHFIQWWGENTKKYDLRLAWAYKRPLHLAQSGAVNLARKNGSSHILFIEDDHWRFPLDGIDVLLSHDKDVIGFATVARKYPYHTLNMKKIDKDLSMVQVEKRNMRPIEYIEGHPKVQRMDLISWAFTLVNTAVFDRIEDPFTCWGIVPTDSVFCQNCEDKGIPRHISFECLLPHGDVKPEYRYALLKAHELSKVIDGTAGQRVPEGIDGIEPPAELPVLEERHG